MQPTLRRKLVATKRFLLVRLAFHLQARFVKMLQLALIAMAIRVNIVRNPCLILIPKGEMAIGFRICLGFHQLKLSLRAPALVVLALRM